MSTAIAPVKNGAPPEHALEVSAPATGLTGANVMALLQAAVEKGTSVESLEKLASLAERFADRGAREAFNRAKAAFKAECPIIRKNKTAAIATQKGGNYSYTYADLPEIVRTVDPLLAKHGFTYSWDMDEAAPGRLTCVCHLRHVDGHSEPAHFTLPTDNNSAMSPQQKSAAAHTFAKRQTLISVLGIVTADEDTDGADPIDPRPISAEQLKTLEKMLGDNGTDAVRFIRYLKVASPHITSLKDLPAARFKEAVAAAQAKLGRVK